MLHFSAVLIVDLFECCLDLLLLGINVKATDLQVLGCSRGIGLLLFVELGFL